MDRKLNKVAKLRKIVNFLLGKYGDRIHIKDFWDGDLCAIGLCDKTEKHLIYISTYGLPAETFNIILENLSDKKEDYQTIGQYNEIPIDRLENILVDHLMINKMH